MPPRFPLMTSVAYGFPCDHTGKVGTKMGICSLSSLFSSRMNVGALPKAFSSSIFLLQTAYFLQVSFLFVTLFGILFKWGASTEILVYFDQWRHLENPEDSIFRGSERAQWGAIELLALLRLLPLVWVTRRMDATTPQPPFPLKPISGPDAGSGAYGNYRKRWRKREDWSKKNV